jgi:site-specific recombinase XerD
MFAAESLQRGRTMALISRDLGHADVVITAKYLHQMGEHGAQGFEAVKPAGYRSS